MSRETAKEAAWAYLNLAVLWTFAVAQPLFDLLKDNPEFFAARGSTGFDIVSFSILLVALPPLLLLGIELLLGLIGRGAEGRERRFLGVLMRDPASAQVVDDAGHWADRPVRAVGAAAPPVGAREPVRRSERAPPVAGVRLMFR